MNSRQWGGRHRGAGAVATAKVLELTTVRPSERQTDKPTDQQNLNAQYSNLFLIYSQSQIY